MYVKVKRLLDITASGLCLIIFLPLMMLISLCVKVESNGPVFFRQLRYGKDEKPFYIVKFRTMRVDAPLLPPSKFENSASYITSLGGFLRRSSLDELPQLINVLKGEMSFVGPRPGAVVNEEELFFERQKRGVFKVRPGITGWAQVNGRDVLAHDIIEKSKYDEFYVQNQGFLLDLQCILRTFRTVSAGDGYAEGVLKI